MAAMELVRAVGPDHQDPFPAKPPGDEREEITGRVVGPMQVLGDQHDRPLLTQPLEETRNASNSRVCAHSAGVAGSSGLGVTSDELGDEPTELARGGIDDHRDAPVIRGAEPPAQGLGDRRERQPSSEPMLTQPPWSTRSPR
jgi:hypothetical protein